MVYITNKCVGEIYRSINLTETSFSIGMSVEMCKYYFSANWFVMNSINDITQDL